MPKDVELAPGEVFAVQSGFSLVAKGVGSGIVVCLHDPQVHVSGMVRALGVANQTGATIPTWSEPAATRSLLQAMLSIGAQAKNITAKLCGGANLFELDPAIERAIQNTIDSIQDTLRQEGIPIVKEDLGGSHGRMVTLNTSDGKVTIETSSGKRKII